MFGTAKHTCSLVVCIGVVLACNPEPTVGGTDGGSSGGEVTGGLASSSATQTLTGGLDCTLGSEGCACVEGLCLGDLECQAGVCVKPEAPTSTWGTTGEPTGLSSTGGTSEGEASTGAPVECEGTINGDVSIMNSTEVEVLAGVRVITGNLSIAHGVGGIPQLACLEEVNTILLNWGNDYSGLQKLKKTLAVMVNGGPGTKYPVFSGLASVESVNLSHVDEPLSFPSVAALKNLILTSSDAPVFADGLSHLEYLKLEQAQGDYTPLDGVVVDRLTISSFDGTTLPTVTLQINLEIFQAPSLTAIPIDFGETFPQVAPQMEEEEWSARIYVHGTAIADLDDFAGITTHRARPRFHANPELVDVSGLSGSSVVLDYALPPEGWGIGVSESGSLCLSHAQMVLGTMMLPAPPLLTGLDEQC